MRKARIQLAVVTCSGAGVAAPGAVPRKASEVTRVSTVRDEASHADSRNPLDYENCVCENFPCDK
jgi:hypothetical protein